MAGDKSNHPLGSSGEYRGRRVSSRKYGCLAPQRRGCMDPVTRKRRGLPVSVLRRGSHSVIRGRGGVFPEAVRTIYALAGRHAVTEECERVLRIRKEVQGE